ncbi:MAG: hypothetical protein IJ493_09355 [Clostridia bacterium]|nr:hypothetical protein [Clostridia bacterium]
MYTPETSRHFKKYIDPSGVVSYILTTRIAPVQQSFYFTNSSMSDDGRFFWFMCTYPPSVTKLYAVLDFETDEITLHPETISAGIPEINPANGDITFCNGSGLYRTAANDPEGAVTLSTASKVSHSVIDRFQKSLQGDKPCSGVSATHLTYSADRSEVMIDTQLRVNGTKVGTINVKTGDYTEWTSVEGRIYNHAAINPVDSNLGMVNEDFYTDAITGEYHLIRRLDDGTLCRIILVTRDGKVEMVPPMFKERATHEWWAADGKSLYSVDMTMGLCRYTLADKSWELRVPGKAWHGHCSKDERYYVTDIDLVEQNFRGCESAVRFYNYETKKDIRIITENPRWNAPDKQNPYHMDPHPQFTGGDRYIAHTVTVDGHIDAALTPVGQLIELTKG